MAEEKKSNKVIETIGDIVTAIILIFSVIFTALTLTSLNSESGMPNIGGYSLFSVQSDSMEPVFFTGDLLVVKPYDGKSDLNEGDIISFRSVQDGEYIINTHRIAEVNKTDDIITYATQGDNTEGYDKTGVMKSEIVGVYAYKSEQVDGKDKGIRLKGLGKVIDFIKGTGATGEKWSITLNAGQPNERQLNLSFLFFVILPLALIFLFQIYKFIVALNNSKKEKLMAELTEKGELSEELKKKAIEEYLAKQAAEKAKETDNYEGPLETGETEAPAEEAPEAETKEEN